MASLEALDSFLIPSIKSTSDTHSKLLEKHWNDEVTSLHNSIQSIIDTNAFCTTVIELFQTFLTQIASNYDGNIATELLHRCNVLIHHFDINFIDLQLNQESMRKIYYDDIKLMVKECTAAIEQCSANESGRVVKRFKILLSSLKKFQKTLNPVEMDDVCQFGNVTQYSGVGGANSKFITKEISDSMKGFNSIFVDSENPLVSIRKTILYESTRRQFSTKNRSQLMKFPSSPVKTIKKSNFFLWFLNVINNYHNQLLLFKDQVFVWLCLSGQQTFI